MRLRSISLLLLLALSLPPGAAAQEHQHGMEGMDMEGMRHDHGLHAMRGMLGAYSMSREASGTAWQPESTPHVGYHTTWNGWDLMTHGFANLVHDHQGSDRGDTKTFSENMLMGMASRDLGPGHLGLRAMLSAEPWTIGASGYPLLLQTGETANGVTPLVDRQHPHDLPMELAATYSVPVGTDSSVFVYAGLPGEPALGGRAAGERRAPRHAEGPDQVFTVGKLSLGYIYDFLRQENLRTGVGAVGSVARIPGGLQELYGSDRPFSWMGFLRVRI